MYMNLRKLCSPTQLYTLLKVIHQVWWNRNTFNVPTHKTLPTLNQSSYIRAFNNNIYAFHSDGILLNDQNLCIIVYVCRHIHVNFCTFPYHRCTLEMVGEFISKSQPSMGITKLYLPSPRNVIQIHKVDCCYFTGSIYSFRRSGTLRHLLLLLYSVSTVSEYRVANV